MHYILTTLIFQHLNMAADHINLFVKILNRIQLKNLAEHYGKSFSHIQNVKYLEYLDKHPFVVRKTLTHQNIDICFIFLGLEFRIVQLYY